ncbi:hypothetical protein COOONC_28067 [Cooperia oncophora]
MDVQGRRTTRALSNVNENIVKRTAAGKDAVLTRRPALKDQRNGANIPLFVQATDAGAKPIARATRSVTTKNHVVQKSCENQQTKERLPEKIQIHPEVVGIDREIQYVEYCDQVGVSCCPTP